MSDDLAAYLGRTGKAALINSAASALSVAVLLPVVIRSIGLSAYGLWSMLNLFVALASLLDLGLTKAVIFGIRREACGTARLFATAFSITTAGFIFTTVLLFSGLALHWPIFGPAVMKEGNLCWWLASCGVLILFSQLTTTLLRGVLEANYKSDVVNIGFAAFSVAFYVTAALVAHFTTDPREMLLGSTCVFIGTLVVHILLVRWLAPTGFSAPTRAVARSLFRYGIGAFMVDFPTIMMGPVFQFQLQRIIPDARAYGQFDLAARIATFAATTLSSLSQPFFALVAGTSEEKSAEMRKNVITQLRLSFALGCVGLCAFALIGSWVLRVLFHSDDAVLFRITLIILAGAALLAALEPVTRMLLGLNRLRSLVAVRFLMLLVALVAAQALIALPVLYRFAIALAVGYAVGAIATFELDRRELWGRKAFQREFSG